MLKCSNFGSNLLSDMLTCSTEGDTISSKYIHTQREFKGKFFKNTPTSKSGENNTSEWCVLLNVASGSGIDVRDRWMSTTLTKSYSRVSVVDDRLLIANKQDVSIYNLFECHVVICIEGNQLL